MYGPGDFIYQLYGWLCTCLSECTASGGSEQWVDTVNSTIHRQTIESEGGIIL